MGVLRYRIAEPNVYRNEMKLWLPRGKRKDESIHIKMSITRRVVWYDGETRCKKSYKTEEGESRFCNERVPYRFTDVVSMKSLIQCLFYVSLFHNLIVLSFSRAAEAIMLSVGWHVVHSTTSKKWWKKFVIKSRMPRRIFDYDHHPWSICTYLCDLVVFEQFPWFVNSRYTPYYLPNPKQSTANGKVKHQGYAPTRCSSSSSIKK